MKTEDLTIHSPEELSLKFLNEEPLYEEMLDCIEQEMKFAEFVTLCVDPYFEYTEDQLYDLQETYELEYDDYWTQGE